MLTDAAVLNYLQQERHRLASSELNGVSLPTQIDSASDIPQSPTATFRPSALSHEITTPPPLEESAAFSSRATTPRGPPSPGLAATRPTLGRDRKKSSSSSNSHNRLRKASRSSILAREAALNDSATFQSPRGPPLDRRAMLVSPDESVSTSNSRLFDTDSPSSAYNTVDTDLDALSLISPATSVTPAHFRDPAPSLKPSALNYSLASQTQNVTSPKKGSHKSTVSDELNEPTLSTRKPRFQKTSDRILSLLNKLSQDFPEDVEAFKRAKRSIFPTPKANPPLQEDDLSGPVCWSFVDNSNM